MDCLASAEVEFCITTCTKEDVDCNMNQPRLHGLARSKLSASDPGTRVTKCDKQNPDKSVIGLRSRLVSQAMELGMEFSCVVVAELCVQDLAMGNGISGNSSMHARPA